MILSSKEQTQSASFKDTLWVCLMGLTGLEPVTSPLSGVRSSQLSYRPFSCRWQGKNCISHLQQTQPNTGLPVPDGAYQGFNEVLNADHANCLWGLGVNHDGQLDTCFAHSFQGIERRGCRGELDGGSDQ